MKVAVLLPGHLRAWNYCRENFISKIYDDNHEIDVFIDTYYEVFRSDYELHGESSMQILKNKDEIKNDFNDINVVDFSVEDEITGEGYRRAMYMQKRKILKIYDSFSKYQDQNGKYDLVVRSRFDILLDKKLDYDYILKKCIKNPKLIFIGNGAVDRDDNDMFAVCSSDTFDLYVNRLNLYPDETDPALHHKSLTHIEKNYGVVYDKTTKISIVRLDGNKNFTVHT